MADEVILRRWPKKEGGRVIAIFPYDIFDLRGSVNSYEHIGQHGAASLDLIDRTSPVSEYEEDAKDLLEELKSIGYEPKVIQRVDHSRYRDMVYGGGPRPGSRVEKRKGKRASMSKMR